MQGTMPCTTNGHVLFRDARSRGPDCHNHCLGTVTLDRQLPEPCPHHLTPGRRNKNRGGAYGQDVVGQVSNDIGPNVNLYYYLIKYVRR